MTLPEGSARLSFSRALLRRLKLAGFEDLRLQVLEVYGKLRSTKRAEEDAEEPVDFARTDRLVADEDLDDTARDTKFRLESRSKDAAHEPPCTDIYPDGLEPYVEATLGEEILMYTRLAQRIEAHLPPIDPIRLAVPPLILKQLEIWKAASAAVVKAENDLDLARKTRAKAGETWKDKMEEIYGELITRVGKKKAERFFPKVKRSKPKAAAPPTPASGQDPPSEDGMGSE